MLDKKMKKYITDLDTNVRTMGLLSCIKCVNETPEFVQGMLDAIFEKSLESIELIYKIEGKK